MSESDFEDEFNQGGYDSDKDCEWTPPKRKENNNFLSFSFDSDEKEEQDHNETLIRDLLSSATHSEASAVELNQNLCSTESVTDPTLLDNNNLVNKLTRKRSRNVEHWKINVRKRKRECGEEYISVTNKTVAAKSIKIRKDCSKCVYKCSEIITKEEQQQVFDNFYALNRQAKKMFIVSSCETCHPERRRKGKNRENSKKKQTIKYYFKIKDRNVQVCKSYFLATLDVSQKTIYTALAKRNFETNTPKTSVHGCHTKKRILEEDVDAVKKHILSFPRIESHYCRRDTKREYLEGSLSVNKMYELYVQQMNEMNKNNIVKLSQYRYIFCNHFNLFFHKPKKDRCSLCELNKTQTTAEENKENTINGGEEYLRHIKEKDAARRSRNLDRQSNQAVVTFDLQNVLSCPKAEISTFYYKTKMSVYNLTAHLSTTNQVYCAIWPEILIGRKGNDIASALIQILKKIIIDNPSFKELILWSDSCVPQNRNSVISYALAYFLAQHSNLEKITIKYSTPGHSCVQEIDSVHSVIERFLNKIEYYSPVSLLRALVNVNSKKQYKIIQLKSNDFLDYQSLTGAYNYNEVPYTKVASLEIKKGNYKIGYKTSHDDNNFCEVSLRRNTRTKKLQDNIFLEPKMSPTSPVFSALKKEAIRAMLPYMPKQDQDYYKAVLPDLINQKEKSQNKSKHLNKKRKPNTQSKI